MAKYRQNLPQLSGDNFMTDGGLETTLIFHNGVELPHFAAFDLLKSASGRETLRDYYLTYANIALEKGLGFILDSPTWRASADWGNKMGYDSEGLAEMNRAAITLLSGIRSSLESPASRMVISGCIGPRGDGYQADSVMSVDEAQRYHHTQMAAFHETEADMVTALTMTNINEAIGITRAAQKLGMPVVISFTVETDGRLPAGQALQEAIVTVDRETGNGPSYYMVNCAHPTHFENVLQREQSWVQRIRGIRANASSCSHAELDEAEELDDGNPVELGGQYKQLKAVLKNLNVYGGCCGTDHRHVAEICEACAA